MILIVGLGNPGTTYEKTWHNVGFLAVDQLADQEKCRAFKISKKWQAATTEGTIAGQAVLIVKPQTFMNESGQAVAALANYHKIEPTDIWLVHDDIDLPLGSVRISRNASAAGHRGVQSVIDIMKSKTMVRFRIGIRSDQTGSIPTEQFVLQKIDRSSTVAITSSIDRAILAITTALADSVEQAMTKIN